MSHLVIAEPVSSRKIRVKALTCPLVPVEAPQGAPLLALGGDVLGPRLCPQCTCQEVWLSPTSYSDRVA